MLTSEGTRQRLAMIEAVLRTVVEVRVRDSSRELIDLELELLRIRSRLVAAA